MSKLVQVIAGFLFIAVGIISLLNGFNWIAAIILFAIGGAFLYSLRYS